MATTDLVTLAEYKTFAGITDTAQDTKITALIDGVSLAIEKYCQTMFIIRSTSQKWNVWESGYTYTGSGSSSNCGGIYKMSGFWLYNYPVVSITSIEDQASPVNSIASTEYTLHPNIGFIALWVIPVPVDVNGNPSYWTITYQAGRFVATANVDTNLKLACNMLISQILDRPNPGIRSKTVGQLSLTYSGTSETLDIFEDVQVLLSPYISQSQLFF